MKYHLAISPPNKTISAIFITLVILCATFLWIDNELKPTLYTIAENNINRKATTIISKTISNLIEEKGIYNYMDFYKEAKSYFDDGSYLEVMRCYGNHFNKLCDGNYQQLLQGRLKVIYGEEWEIENVLQNAPSQAKEHEKEHEIICPDCGSEFVTKKGKTQAGSQRWKCKACQKIFV